MKGNASWYMVSKLNHFDDDSTPKNTNRAMSTVPTIFPATSGLSGKTPNPVASVHTPISKTGFHGTSDSCGLPMGLGRSSSGSRRIERRTQSIETSGSTTENTAICAGSRPVNTHLKHSPSTMAPA